MILNELCNSGKDSDGVNGPCRMAASANGSQYIGDVLSQTWLFRSFLTTADGVSLVSLETEYWARKGGVSYSCCDNDHRLAGEAVHGGVCRDAPRSLRTLVLSKGKHLSLLQPHSRESRSTIDNPLHFCDCLSRRFRLGMAPRCVPLHGAIRCKKPRLTRCQVLSRGTNFPTLGPGLDSRQVQETTGVYKPFHGRVQYTVPWLLSRDQ